MEGSIMKKFFVFMLIFVLCFSVVVYAQEAKKKEVKKDKAIYKDRYIDPVIKEMFEKNAKLKEEAAAKTKEIIKAYKEQIKKERKSLLFDMSAIEKPASPDVFKPHFHFDPVAQYLTGTCWCFSATSMLESELYRLNKKKIKLSEMHTVYYEFVEKARYFVKTRGSSLFTMGAEFNSVTRMWEKYGAVPYDAYPGVLAEDGRYDHSEMYAEMSNYLKYIKEHDYWCEKTVVSQIKAILNKYMGKPPKSFTYEDKEMTPLQFLKDVLKLNPNDYVAVMSTLSVLFYTKGEYAVPDNWWHSKEYYNVPLDVFYGIIKKALKEGYTVAIGGDTSEPGKNGFEDAAIIPTFDIPQEYIDQSAREFRFYNRTSTDDHGIHIVGYTRLGDHDWFLIKDSGRSARYGKFEGYYFFRDDYIKLKMLAYMVHKDVLKDILPKFKEKEEKQETAAQ
jgi:bleomycin hydrolase